MKKTYIKPCTETIELYLEKTILAASETMKAYEEDGEINAQGKQNSFDVFDMDEEEY